MNTYEIAEYIRKRISDEVVFRVSKEENFIRDMIVEFLLYIEGTPRKVHECKLKGKVRDITTLLKEVLRVIEEKRKEVL